MLKVLGTAFLCCCLLCYIQDVSIRPRMKSYFPPCKFLVPSASFLSRICFFCDDFNTRNVWNERGNLSHKSACRGFPDNSNGRMKQLYVKGEEINVRSPLSFYSTFPLFFIIWACMSYSQAVVLLYEPSDPLGCFETRSIIASVGKGGIWTMFGCSRAAEDLKPWAKKKKKAENTIPVRSNTFHFRSLFRTNGKIHTLSRFPQFKSVLETGKWNVSYHGLLKTVWATFNKANRATTPCVGHVQTPFRTN